MKVAVDENLPPKLARSLAALFEGEHKIIHIREKYKGFDDQDWIIELSKEGNWIVISGDIKISKKKAQIAAFRSSKLIGFFICPALMKLKITKQMQRILALWEDIENLQNTVRVGSMFELPMSGKVRPLK